MQFIHPLWLLGLLAVAIPVIIHLFNFRRYRKYYFTNLKFLKSIKKETQKQHRLRHLLILISRILAITFLVLAFARPYIPGPEGVNRSSSAHISMYVDNSMSMQAAQNGHTLLDEALAKAENIAMGHNTSDRFQLITNDFEGKHQSWYNKDEFLALLRDVRISYRTRNSAEIVERMDELAEETSGTKPRLYVISDFQQTTTELDPLFSDTARLVFLLPLVQEELSNIYIDTCWMSSPFNHAGQHQELNVRLQNASGLSLEKIPVRLNINGDQRGLASVNIEANGQALVRLPFTNRTPGLKAGSIAIDDYPISWDDKMFISWEVKDRIPVLVISEDEPGYYLDAIFTNDSVFIYNKANVRKLVYSEFAAMDLIVLDAVKSISSGLRSELQDFIRSGGSLLLIPSAEADIASINALTTGSGAGRLAPIDTTRMQVTGLNTQHEVFADVFETVPDNIDLPDVFRHYGFQDYRPVNTDVLLELQNARPFISMSKYGQGRLYVVLSPMDEGSTNLARHALWVPLVYRMAMLSRPREKLYNVVGNDLVIEAPNTVLSGDQSFSMKLMDGAYEFIPGYRGRGTTAELYLYDQLNTAGHYILSAGEKQRGLYAFNYDRTESDPALIPLEDLNDEMASSPNPNIFLVDIGEMPVNEYVKAFDQGREFWKICVWIALAFIFTEILLLRFWR